MLTCHAAALGSWGQAPLELHEINKGKPTPHPVVSLAAQGCTQDDSPSAKPSEAATGVRLRTGRPPAEPYLDPQVVLLINQLTENGYRLEMTGDRVTAPESFGRLLAMGGDALPTVLQVAETTKDDSTRDVLIDIAGRIGDPLLPATLTPV